jgi:hypothetical protein
MALPMEPERSEAAKIIPLLPFEQQKFHPEYQQYFKQKRGNFFKAIEEFPGLWDCFQLLSVIWFREMADLATATDEKQMLPRTLFSAAHARFLTAMELGFACCVGDAYGVLRDGIETVSHAYKVFKEPHLITVWAQKGTAAYQKTFEENKKQNLFPDEHGLSALQRHYAAFSEIATHTNPTPVGTNFREIRDANTIRWEYHYFVTDPRNLAVFLFTLLDASALMEQVFFACFQSRLGFDHALTHMHKSFDQLKQQQKQSLKDKYSLGADFLPSTET